MTGPFAPGELSGERARLVPMTPVHAPALLEAGRDEAIWPYLPAHPRTLEDFGCLIAEAVAEREAGHECPFVIMDLHTGDIVGSTRLTDIFPNHKQAEIGWTWLAPAAQRTRINTECKFLLLRHAFEAMGLVRVCLKADARNLRSLHAIERLGATKEGVLRRHRILPDGFVRDSVYYSVIAEEWPAVKQRLEGFLADDCE